MSGLSSKDFIPTLLQTSSKIAGLSNSFPQGEDYSFMQLDVSASEQTEILQDKLTQLLSTLVQFITPEVCTTEYDDIVEASDRCLEHVAITLDSRKNPTPNIGKLSNYDLPKPELPWRCDNSREPFQPNLRHKPHAVLPIDLSPQHPYIPELEKLVFAPSQLAPDLIKPSNLLLDTPLIYVDSADKLAALALDLSQQTEFAVDLEHHSFRSYKGFTCLIQISTRNRDYIVDPFPIWDKLELLLEVFTDPNIVKVFHGADSDVMWLQRDFGIYVVNMFDTGQAARKLMFSHFGLAFLLENICSVKTDKSFQLADWRVRPLTENHLKYARMDTHYLLEIYDNLKYQLQSKASSLKLNQLEMIKDVFMKSKDICMKFYEKTDLTMVGINGIELLSKKQRRNLESIARWRDSVARDEDENPNYILASRKVMMLAEECPGDMKGLTKIVQNINFVKKYGERLLEVLIKANAAVDIEEVYELPKVFKDSMSLEENKPYIEKFKVNVTLMHSVSYGVNENCIKHEKSQNEKLQRIQNSLRQVFSEKAAEKFNKAKPIVFDTRKVEEKVEEIPQSIKDKYMIPIKNKIPGTRKPKQTMFKRQKISEHKDIKIGWLDNVELMPVKRKNLFKKK